MSLTIGPGGHPLGVREAYDALGDYARTYGELPLRLLLHVAVLQSFRADLLNLLKINFVPEAGDDLSVDADVLLSPLVEATAAGYFRLDPEVRRQSLDLLDAVYRSDGSRRSVRVAWFLIAWLNQLHQVGAAGMDPLLAEYAVIQRWVALALIDPLAIAAALARSLSDALAEDETAVRVRLGGVAAALSIPLSGHQPLLSYAQGVDALHAGNAEEARRFLAPLGNSEIRIGDVTLCPASDLLDKYFPRRLVAAAKPPGSNPDTGEPPKDPRDLPDFVVFRDINQSWCPEMVVLPAGEFLMGSPKDEKERNNDESPQHLVTIGQRFALGRYSVTFYEYDYFCAAKKREKPDDQGWGRDRRPVINVSWEDAQAYVNWLAEETGQSYRLPSEAEWEYACRAGTITLYSFGNEITPKNANYGETELGRTTEVGSYPPNFWGLHDMHGNVWEWIEDVWHDNYHAAPADGSAWTDQKGLYSLRLGLRGGSWQGDPGFCRSACRGKLPPWHRSFDFGFRVARTL